MTSAERDIPGLLKSLTKVSDKGVRRPPFLREAVLNASRENGNRGEVGPQT